MEQVGDHCMKFQEFKTTVVMWTWTTQGRETYQDFHIYNNINIIIIIASIHVCSDQY